MSLNDSERKELEIQHQELLNLFERTVKGYHAEKDLRMAAFASVMEVFSASSFAQIIKEIDAKHRNQALTHILNCIEEAINNHTEMKVKIILEELPNE